MLERRWATPAPPDFSSMTQTFQGSWCQSLVHLSELHEESHAYENVGLRSPTRCCRNGALFSIAVQMPYKRLDHAQLGNPYSLSPQQCLDPLINRLKIQFDLSLPQLGPAGQPWPSDLLVVSHIVLSDSNI